ncbi:hypothetical protein [Conchiformibius kuhniae]|uniref:Uncharacterized protein n=1 Tax=Conchiformibius kuhniae TaxID=211502 RepID=A0ABD8B6N6_9NEIS|nr:hypothetical protein [Conchiformibius kuhniae]
MSNHTNSKFTFGNILLGLLALGTLIVSALMALVYFEVTRTPKRTAAIVQQENGASAAPVEAMSPDGRPVTVATANPGAEAASAPADPDRRKEAEAAASALNADSAAALPPVNTRALTGGQQVPRKPRPKRPPRETANAEAAQNTRSQRSQNTGGEVALEPVNVPRERPLPPRNRNSDSGNSRPSRQSQASSGERELTPVRPAQNNRQTEAIDALF